MERTSPIGCAAFAVVVFLCVMVVPMLFDNSAWLRSVAGSGTKTVRTLYEDGSPRHEVRRERRGSYHERVETTWRPDGTRELEVRVHELTPDLEERRYWGPDGVLDWERSGTYDRGERILDLESEEPRRSTEG